MLSAVEDGGVRQALLLLLVALAPGSAALSLEASPLPANDLPVDVPTLPEADLAVAGQQASLGADGSVSLDASAVPALPGLPELTLDTSALDLEVAARRDAEDASAQGAHGQTIAGVPAQVAVPVAAGASAVGLALLWRLLGISVPFAGRLFSRIEAPRVLDNPVRARLNDLVLASPGATLEELRAAAGIAWGTAVHHLRRLEAHGLVVSTTAQARHRFFPANTAVSKHRASVAALQQPTAQRIARAVHDAPGIGQEQICVQLGLKGPSASKHLGRFANQGLVTVRADGRRRSYQATDELRAALGLLAAPATASAVPFAATVPVAIAA